ncbi:MAG TPA: hemerythrin domain-containing protein [Acidimicrobiia bacterium]|nr:hemerythrin domain-containing protein [Acidimicrobiia bacterium]
MPPDLAELIAHDHQVIAGLLAAVGDGGRADRFPLAHRLLDELAAHTAAELQILYPALRDIVPGGVEMANRGQTDHDTLRPVLVALEQAHPDDAAFDALVGGVAAAVDGHVPPVENEFLPALAAVVGPETMVELGAVYASLKDSLPTGLDALPGAAPGPRFTTG